MKKTMTTSFSGMAARSVRPPADTGGGDAETETEEDREEGSEVAAASAPRHPPPAAAEAADAGGGEAVEPMRTARALLELDEVVHRFDFSTESKMRLLPLFYVMMSSLFRLYIHSTTLCL